MPEWWEAARRRIEEANRADPLDAIPEFSATARRGAGRAAQPEEPAEQEAEATPAPQQSQELTVPPALRLAGDYAWRIGVVCIVAAGAWWGLSHVSTLVIPVMIAALLAGLLLPVKNFLRLRWHWPNALSVLGTFLVFLAVIGGAVAIVASTMANGARELILQATAGLHEVQRWLQDGPLHITTDTLNRWLSTGLTALGENTSSVVRSAASGLSVVGHVGAGILLVFFSLIFFLLEGERIWRWVVGLFPRRARGAVDGAGRRGWGSLVSYVRIQVVVAVIDAVGIGTGAMILQVPLALPLAVLVLLGSFVPILGALVTGALAVLLALVSHGWVIALIMLAVVLGVQQIESHILQPLIMGRAVSLHPLAVVLAVAGGTLLFGVAGALFAVPVMAVVNTVVKYLAHRAWEHDPVVQRAAIPGAAAPSSTPEGVRAPEGQHDAGPEGTA